MTTMTYDEGWKVFVDGNQIETYCVLDALIAFNIEGEGEHTLEMRYMPDIYVFGMKISIVGISVFVVICVLDIVLKKLKITKANPKNKNIYWVLEDFDEDHEQSLMEAYLSEEKKNLWDFFKKKTKKTNDEDNGEI